MSLLSVVIPAYNEEQNIALAAARLSEVLETADIPYELIFVDDGSRDRTYPLICEEARCNPAVRGISFSRNFGKESAIFAGLAEAKGDACVVTDCDLQFPPEVIPQMWELWRQGYAVVEGKKSARGKKGDRRKGPPPPPRARPPVLSVNRQGSGDGYEFLLRL